MTPRPRWASAVAAVGVATSGTLFLVDGNLIVALIAILVAGVFAAQAGRGS